MLFLDVEQEVVKEPVSNAKSCACGRQCSVSRTTVIDYLSFSFMPVIPYKISTRYSCGDCKQNMNSVSIESWTNLILTRVATKATGAVILLLLFLFLNQYQELQTKWEAQARVAPRVNDILYLDNYVRTASKEDEYFPIRLAKVVAIDADTNTLSLAISSTSYDSLRTAKKDYAVRSYLFDTFYLVNTVEVNVSHLNDETLVLNIRRPFGEEIPDPAFDVNSLEKYQDLTRFFKYGIFDVRSFSGTFEPIEVTPQLKI